MVERIKEQRCLEQALTANFNSNKMMLWVRVPPVRFRHSQQILLGIPADCKSVI